MEEQSPWGCRKEQKTRYDYLKRYHQYVAPTTIDPDTSLIVKKADGMELWDIWENCFIDFDASIATVPLGHHHPIITEGLIQQLHTVDFVESSARPTHFSITVAGKEYEISPMLLAQKLIQSVFPRDDISAGRVFFNVTGALAVEDGAMLLLRQRPERRKFISFYGAFHGRHGYARDITFSKPEQKKCYPPGIETLHLPFPKNREDMACIHHTLERVSLEEINAVFVEPIQGEGGIECWNKNYWEELESTFRKEGIAIACDVIQCGMGRTGTMWGFEQFGMRPDMVIVGKGLGNGQMISAIVYRKYLEKTPLENGWNAGTFSGHPAGLTAATLTLAIIQEEHMLSRVKKMGVLLERALKEAIPTRDDTPFGSYCIHKGRGLMQGIEFRDESENPDPQKRDEVLKKLFDRGIVTIPCGHPRQNPTIRFLPPYIIEGKHIEYLYDCLVKIF